MKRDEYSGTTAWIGYTIGGFDSVLDLIYFSFYITRGRDKIQPSVAVIVVTANSTYRDRLLRKCKEVSQDFEKWNGNEIGIEKPIEASNIDSLEEELGQLIDKWHDVWARIEGGVEGLKK